MCSQRLFVHYVARSYVALPTYMLNNCQIYEPNVKPFTRFDPDIIRTA